MKKGTGTMKKVALVSLLVVVSTLLLVPLSDAAPRGRHRPVAHARVFVGVGPAVWWGPYPYWYYPPPYAVYAPPPVIVQEAPPVYIQQAPPPAPAPSAAAEQFWYYCPSGKGYYPTVPSCSETWLKVAPR
jgi:hypothetical protein